MKQLVAIALTLFALSGIGFAESGEPGNDPATDQSRTNPPTGAFDGRTDRDPNPTVPDEEPQRRNLNEQTLPGDTTVPNSDRERQRDTRGRTGQ